MPKNSYGSRGNSPKPSASSVDGLGVSSGKSSTGTIEPKDATGSYQSETIAQLLPWLNWVDGRIRSALAAGQAVHGAESRTDAFRGLYITPHDVDRLLTQPPGHPLFGHSGHGDFPEHMPLPPSFARLAQACHLSAFDIAVVFIVLAPEIDLRYERLYAYLQDDINKKRPSVDLVLNLLCADVATKLQMHSRFQTDTPLVGHRLIQLIPDNGRTDSPLLAYFLKLDDLVIASLLGNTSLDRRLAPSCELFVPGDTHDSPPPRQDAVLSQPPPARSTADTGEPLRLYFEGPDNLEKRWTARLYAAKHQRPLVVAHLAQMQAVSVGFEASLRVLFRQTWLLDAALFLDGYEALRDSDRPLHHRHLLQQLAEFTGTVFLAGTFPWKPQEEVPLGIATISFGIPTAARRLDCWRNSLQQHGILLDEETLRSLSVRFQLTSAQIADATGSAIQRTRWEAPSRTSPTGHELFEAARQQTRNTLAKLATRIDVFRHWEGLILPDDAIAQLREVCNQFTHRQQVLTEWGFARKLAYGTGINALFTGPSGTGKTMAAEIVAKELGLDLYKIDLAAVVSKYIGETEKNLDKIFTAADHANAILFFDEADALFGKRSEVKDSHDRYANLEISYLLQRMEQYEGIAILATNLRQNLDEAFVRRLAFIVQFPFPDEMMRKRIWADIWPASVPLAEDVDLDALAKQLKLSGGNIRNIALSAAYLAAGNGQIVTREHIQQASQRELQKLGRSPTQTGEELYRISR